VRTPRFNLDVRASFTWSMEHRRPPLGSCLRCKCNDADTLDWLVGWLERSRWRKLGHSDEGSLKAALHVPFRGACPNEPTRQIDHLLAKHRRASAGKWTHTETVGSRWEACAVLQAAVFSIGYWAAEARPSLWLYPYPWPPKGSYSRQRGYGTSRLFGLAQQPPLVRRGTKRDEINWRVAIRSYTPPPLPAKSDLPLACRPWARGGVVLKTHAAGSVQ